MSRIEHVVRYASAAGDNETRWIRLEQEGTDETVTVDEAAELIDALYEIDPCVQGATGGGGEVAPEEPPPTERLDELGREFLGGDLCGQAEWWIARVRVYRSHRAPEEYVLRSATAEIVSTERDIYEPVREIIENPGNSVDLEHPYADGLVLPPGLRGEVRGSTLNLSRPVSGVLVVRYRTVYDRVTLRVPVIGDDSGGTDEERARRSALDAAGLIVFWGTGAEALADAVALDPPPQDEETTAAELESLCGRRSEKKDATGGCYKIVTHYMKCRCSDREAQDPLTRWDEQVSASCPEGKKPGSRVGRERRFDGYTTCPGDMDEQLADREYYKEKCCRYPYDFAVLPTCRIRYEQYRGGAPIRGGADYWRARYGERARLVAVTPKDGICGQQITTWNVEQQNCCDDIIPLEPHPDNPTAIHAGERHRVGAVQETGRRGDLIWTLRGGITFPDGTTQKVDGARIQEIVAGPSICPQPWVKIDDGCQPLMLRFEGGGSTLPEFGEDYEDMAIAPETVFSLTVGGGVPPYMWIVGGGLELLGISEDTKSAMMRTKGVDEWCVEQVRAQDQCGEQAVSTIRNSRTGSWKRMTEGVDYDKCSAPGGASVAIAPNNGGYMWLKPAGGWSVRIYRNGGQYCGRGSSPCGEGNIIAKNSDDVLRNDCNSKAGSIYTKTYSDGYCRIVRQYDGYSICFYYHDQVSDAYKWVCA